MIQKKISLVFVILTCLFLASSCSSEKKDWQAAQESDQISSYMSFILKHPESEFCGNARQRMDTLWYEKYKQRNSVYAFQEFIREFPHSSHIEDAESEIQRLYEMRSDGFENVREAVIEININVPEGVTLTDPGEKQLKNRIKTLLLYAGIKPVETPREKAGNKNLLIVKLSAKGSALGTTYNRGLMSWQKGKYYYTGASIRGKITFSVNGKTALERELKARENPPKQTMYMKGRAPVKKSDAPFGMVWEQINIQKIIFEWVEKHFGRDTLVDAMPALVAGLINPGEVKDKNRWMDLLIEAKPRHRMINILEGNYWAAAKEFVLDTLRKINEPWIIDPILSCIRNDKLDNYTDMHAIRILIECQDPSLRIVKTLINEMKKAVDNHSWRMKYKTILEALEKMTGNDFGNNIRRWERWVSEEELQMKRSDI